MNAHDYEKEISDLFEIWIEKQKNEPNYDNSDIDMSSFTFDGVISPYDYYSSKERILFIAKESHLKQGEKFNNEFWLKNVYEKKSEVNEKLFSKRISMAANAIFNDNYTEPNKSHEILKHIAFMNLNKRGGRSSCDPENLKKYILTYEEQIKKEIEILNPTIIICAGKSLKSYLKDFEQKYKIIEIYHPSYYFKSDKEHLEKLKDEIEKLN